MSALPPLRGRTAVVTGAGSGIGRALALAAAERGMAVAIADVDARGLAITEAAVRSYGVPCLSRTVDVTDTVALAAFSGEVGRSLPLVVLLFANAGILRAGSMLTMPIVRLRALFEVNVLGAVATVQAFAPHMQAHGEGGHIVITGSTGTMASYTELAGYCATKHALWPIAEALRDDLDADEAKIGVSLLMPGAVSTAIFDSADPDRAQPDDSITPDAAAAIAFQGIGAGDFLIVTHPTFVTRTDARFDATTDALKRSAQRTAAAPADRAFDPVPT